MIFPKWNNHVYAKAVRYLVAVRDDDGVVVGTVTGVDHEVLFADPERGSSMWALAVDPGAALPGVGEALTAAMIEHFRTEGRAYLDLSVAHDNDAAIALYEKLGFVRIPVMAIKRKNAINEPLFNPPPETIDDLNPYARIIADEALRRGIHVEVKDVVVKPTRGDQGKGITVGISVDDGADALTGALDRAREQHPDVLIEEVIGTGEHSVRDLIQAESRRRARASDGEASIALDEVTEATITDEGWTLDDVLPEGTRLRVRRTANIHQGGTIEDVTAEVHPELRDADRLGGRHRHPAIEANERPGLANHEPQPTAAAFLDFLFPGRPAPPQAWAPEEAQ